MEGFKEHRIAQFNIGKLEDFKRVEVYIDFENNCLIFNAHTGKKVGTLTKWTQVVRRRLYFDEINPKDLNFKDLIVEINNEIDAKTKTFELLTSFFEKVDSVEIETD